MKKRHTKKMAAKHKKSGIAKLHRKEEKLHHKAERAMKADEKVHEKIEKKEKKSEHHSKVKHHSKKKHAKKKVTKGKAKVAKVMHEYKTGKLHSSSKKGPIVKNRAQAIAIGLSEARKAGAHIPKKSSAKHKKKSK